MDDPSYFALALALTLVAGTYTWFAYQKRGVGAGLKGVGISVLPLAAYLTKTLEMVTRIGDAIGDWAVRLVFSPVVWAGIVLAGIGVLLIGAGRVVEARGAGAPVRRPRKKKVRGPEQLSDAQGPAAQAPASRTPATQAPAPRSSIDDDLADIEALLKSRGIT